MRKFTPVLIIFLLIFFWISASKANCQETSIQPKPDAPSKSASDSSPSSDKFENVRSMIPQALEKTGVSSIAVVVAKDGQIIWEEGFGLANRKKTLSSLNMKKPLGRMGFTDGVFKGMFFGCITTPDTAHAPHVIFINMKLLGNRMDGNAAAIAMDRNFCLPNWIELTKLSGHKEN